MSEDSDDGPSPKRRKIGDTQSKKTTPHGLKKNMMPPFYGIDSHLGMPMLDSGMPMLDSGMPMLDSGRGVTYNSFIHSGFGQNLIRTTENMFPHMGMPMLDSRRGVTDSSFIHSGFGQNLIRTTENMVSNLVKETRQSILDPRSSLQMMAIGHHLEEKVHLIEKKKPSFSGEQEESNECLDNIEGETFDYEWQQKTQLNGPIDYEQDGIFDSETENPKYKMTKQEIKEFKEMLQRKIGFNRMCQKHMPTHSLSKRELKKWCLECKFEVTDTSIDRYFEMVMTERQKTKKNGRFKILADEIPLLLEVMASDHDLHVVQLKTILSSEFCFDSTSEEFEDFECDRMAGELQAQQERELIAQENCPEASERQANDLTMTTVAITHLGGQKNEREILQDEQPMIVRKSISDTKNGVMLELDEFNKQQAEKKLQTEWKGEVEVEKNHLENSEGKMANPNQTLASIAYLDGQKEQQWMEADAMMSVNHQQAHDTYDGDLPNKDETWLSWMKRVFRNNFF